MATGMGTVKKTRLSEFSRPRAAGIIAVDLDDGDFLIGAAQTDGKHDIMLFSDQGKAVRFDENDVRPMGRGARGVRGMRLAKGHKVMALLAANNETQSVLTATENGFGKRTPIVEYTRHGRGTQGMIAIQTSARNGKVVAATLVDPTDDEIMLITSGGVLIRTADQGNSRNGPFHPGRHADQDRRRRKAGGNRKDRGAGRRRGIGTAIAAMSRDSLQCLDFERRHG